ncbi:MAG: O-antigen ligase family protein [Ignavibacteriaceae bacterium]|nr:O-antigen ligase family protein [Ignavibacteriaceae bacterium]
MFVVLSFLLTHKYEFQEFKNKILNYFGIFILSLIPSYYNLISNVTEALPLSLHLIFFVLTFTIISASIQNHFQIRDLIILFLAVSLINGLFVVALALLTGQRVFGFSGIMYVDYVGYSIVISFIFLMLKKRGKLISLIVLCILSLALIFTQTRSIWLVTGATLFLSFLHLFFSSQKYQLSRLKLSVGFISIIFAISIFTLTLKDVNKDYFERVEIKKIEQTDDPMRLTLQINSLVTRYFIWSAAWEAFINNPVIGVGIYGFPFVSKEYSDVDPFLYKSFIEKLTPHETFLAILTEGGILGFLGFMFFLISTILYAIKNYKLSRSQDELFYSELILWLTIYTLLSMIVTDAWLWGHGIVLWGVLLGLSIANRKILGRRTGIAST